MRRTTASFDDMAVDFDRLFDDVGRLTCLEAQSLDVIFRPHGVQTVLDCACGTGIQSIGLAQLGYSVSASDISAGMVELTREKARLLDLSIDARRSDFRTLAPWRGRLFDAVICTGNSITLLPDQDEMARAVHAMVRRAKPEGGLLVLGVHNYLRPKALGENLLLRHAQLGEGVAEVALDVRLFNGDRVNITYMIVRRQQGRWRLKTYEKSYVALSAPQLAGLLSEAGLRGVRLLDVTGERTFIEDDEWVLAVGQR